MFTDAELVLHEARMIKAELVLSDAVNLVRTAIDSFDTTIIPSLDTEALEYLYSITAPYHFPNPKDVVLHEQVGRELEHRQRIKPPVPV